MTSYEDVLARAEAQEAQERVEVIAGTILENLAVQWPAEDEYTILAALALATSQFTVSAEIRIAKLSEVMAIAYRIASMKP